MDETYMKFSSAGMHIFSSLIHLLGVSILAHILSRRFMTDGNGSLRQASWPRICILLVFVDSYLFLFSAGVLILGTGLEYSKVTCSLGIYLCIVFYASSKVLIYCFLVERVHIVWRPSPTAKRLKSKVYIICLVVMLGYAVILALLFYGRVSMFTGSGACKIGLKPVASIPLLTYDLFINIFLTGLFVWPLFRSNYRNSKIKRLGIRTLCSALVALTTSCVNILILTIMRGRQLGWVCLGSCGTDVIVNAAVLFWVTDSASEKSASSGPGVATSNPLYLGCTPGDNADPSLTPAVDMKMDRAALEWKTVPKKVPMRGIKNLFSGRWLGRQSLSSDVNGAKGVEVRITRETGVHESSIADTDYEMRNIDK